MVYQTQLGSEPKQKRVPTEIIYSFQNTTDVSQQIS